METDIVTLNVGGTVFKTTWSTLKRFPNSKLGKLAITSDNFLNGSKEFFFNWSPENFNFILDCFRCEEGQIHLPNNLCGKVLVRELEFWEMSIENISECCFNFYNSFKCQEDFRRNIKRNLALDGTQEAFISKRRSLQHKAWLFLNQPKSSRAAMVFFVIFITMVLFSVVLTCLQSDPSFRVSRKPPHLTDTVGNINKTGVKNVKTDPKPKKQDEFSWKIKLYMETRPVSALIILDDITSAFFATELVLHFLVCPKKKQFLSDVHNKIDLLTFVITGNFYIAVHLARTYMIYSSFRLYFILSHVAVMFKLLRLFRLAKVYKELQILIKAIRASMKELLLLSVAFGTVATVFGTLVYHAELTEPDSFPDIFTGIWWAVVTMTTVGYGDVVPKSTAGFLVGVVTSMSGLLIIAMPIAVISKTFDSYYDSYNSLISKSLTQGKLKKGSTAIFPSCELSNAKDVKDFQF